KHPRSKTSRLIRATETTNSCILPTDQGLQLWRKFETPIYKKLRRAQNFMESVAIDLISEKISYYREDRQQQFSAGYMKRSSLIDEYLKNPNLDLSDIVGVGNDLLLAGVDTTSYTTSFVLYYLGRYPEVQKKVFEEAKKFMKGKHDQIEGDALRTDIPYTRAFFSEPGQALRMCGELLSRPFMDVTIMANTYPALIDTSSLQTKISSNVSSMVAALTLQQVQDGNIQVQFQIGSKFFPTLCKVQSLEEGIDIQLGMDVLYQQHFRLRINGTTIYGHNRWTTQHPDDVQFAYNLPLGKHLRQKLIKLGYELQDPYSRRNLQDDWKQRRTYFSRFRDI
uniref:Cytochrome P450 n=1 Tax=Megaselia scalaris TaxID=36166 RepID=T1GFZ6_MEGSC